MAIHTLRSRSSELRHVSRKGWHQLPQACRGGALLLLLVSSSCCASWGVTGFTGGITAGPQGRRSFHRIALQAALDRLITAAADDSVDLDAQVEAEFPNLQLTDFALLNSAQDIDSDAAASKVLKKLKGSVQASMEKRMEQAAVDLNQLIQSEGDINQNIRDCLGRLDNPVPLIAILELNIKGAQEAGGADKLGQALAYIYGQVMSELQSSIPLERKVLGDLLVEEDSKQRLIKLRRYLDPTQEKPVDPDLLADAILDIVSEVQKKYQNASAEAMRGALKRIKDIATQSAAVVGKVRPAEGEAAAFSAKMQPIIDLLSQ